MDIIKMSFDKALCLAVTGEDTKLTELLLLNGANVNYMDKNRKSPMDYAIEYKQYSQMNFLIGHYGAKFFDDKKNMLLFSYNNEDLDMLKILLDNGTDPNVAILTQCGLKTILYHASHDNKIEIVKLLLEYKNVNIDVRDSIGVTPLRIACVYGNSEIVKMLMDAGADPNVSNKNTTPLIRSIEEKNKNCTKILLSYPNIKIDLQDKCGNTALIHAVQKNYDDLVEKIIQYGADITLKNEYGKSAIDYSTSDKITSMLGTEINSTDYEYPTDKVGEKFPILIPKILLTIRAICFGKCDRDNINMPKDKTFLCHVWDHDKENWIRSTLNLPYEFIIEIANKKMHYHVHPTKNNEYIRFEALTMSDGIIKNMEELYE
jgi:ankyrin repeat protein